ncbi:MAG TPA: type 1 glutamine amidotransferase domain-containing protein [Chitinophagaceae bacterium]
MKSIRILFVTTSHHIMGESTRRTGLWLDELATPYYIFKEAGAEVTIASPKGGLVPLDPKSQSILIVTSSAKQFLKDEEAMNFLAHSIVLEEVKAEDFDGVFLPGGHGPMWDLADNRILKQLLEKFNKANKPIGAVCHGVVGLISLQNEKEEFLVKGKNLTGFSNSEEESAGLTSTVPFLLETKLLSLGALYSRGSDYLSYVIVDGNIITGQNPASSGETARKLLALVKHNEHQTVYYNLSLAK